MSIASRESGNDVFTLTKKRAASLLAALLLGSASAVVASGKTTEVVDAIGGHSNNTQLVRDCLEAYASFPNTHTIQVLGAHSIRVSLTPFNMRQPQGTKVDNPNWRVHPECTDAQVTSTTSVEIDENGQPIAAIDGFVSSADMGRTVSRLVRTGPIACGSEIEVSLSTTAETATGNFEPFTPAPQQLTPFRVEC